MLSFVHVPSPALCARLGIAIVLLFGAVGCGKGRITGKVTYRGKAVISGGVTVYDSSGCAHPGTIQEDGTYTIEDIPAGLATFEVSSPDPTNRAAPRDLPEGTPGKEMPQGSAQVSAAARDGWQSLPSKYATAETSGLSFKIKRGNNEYNIELTD